MLGIALAVVMALLLAKHRSSNPIIPLAIFRNRTFSISILSFTVLGASMFGTIIFIPLFMQGVVGASATNSGIVLTQLMLSMIMSSVVGGQLISRTGRYRWAVILGLLSMQGKISLMSRMGADTSDKTVVRNMIATGIELVMPTITIAVQSANSSTQLGVVTSSLQFFRQIRGTVGIALIGTLLTNRLVDNLARDLPHDTLEALHANVVTTLDPQALANPDARQQLQASHADVKNGLQLCESL